MSQFVDDAPTSVGLREFNVEARRQRILGAARRLITSGGMAELSMRKLAKEASLSVTTLYNLFGVREEILQALVMDAIDRMDLVLKRDAPLDDPIERCRAIVTVSVRHMVENEAIFRPMAIAAQEASMAGGHSSGKVTRRAVEMQALAIRAAIEHGVLTDLLDPLQLGQQIYHGFEFASIKWALGLIDAAGFEARALYGLDVALLGVASDSVRPDLEAELHRLEKQLDSRSHRPSRRARKDS